VGAVENLCKHYGDVKAVMGSFLFALPAGCTCNLTLYALRPMMNRTDAGACSSPASEEGGVQCHQTSCANSMGS
jgi:hypothetical protein